MEMEAVIALLDRCRLDWELISSDVIAYEIFQIPDQNRLLHVREITSLARETVEWDDHLEERADILAASGIDAMDALHVACAERAGAVFVTTDDLLIKNIKRMSNNTTVRVCNPVDLYLEVKKNEDQNTP
jgi:predicted nucleic acid-binding protein